MDQDNFKEYNELNNELRDAVGSLGSELGLSFPRIAVFGDTSSGKSSVLTQMTKISFPKAKEVCTRVPIELRLETTDDFSATCFIEKNNLDDSYEFNYEDINDELSKINDRESFTSGIESAIEKLQNLIVDTTKQKFSKSKVVINAKSPDVPTLTLIDLPGLVSKEEHKAMIEDIYKDYLTDEATVLVCVVQATSESVNQDSFNLVKKNDNDMERTVCVLTKGDRIEKGCEKDWLDIVNNMVEDYQCQHHGWFMTRCRLPAELEGDEKISIEQAISREKQFFEGTLDNEDSKRLHRNIFSKVPREFMGIPNLQHKVTEMLMDRMKKILPKTREKAEEKLAEMRKLMVSLGENLPSNEGKLKDILADKIQGLREMFAKLLSGDFDVDQKNNIYGKIKVASREYFQEIGKTNPIFSHADLWVSTETVDSPYFYGFVFYGPPESLPESPAESVPESPPESVLKSSTKIYLNFGDPVDIENTNIFSNENLLELQVIDRQRLKVVAAIQCNANDVSEFSNQKLVWREISTQSVVIIERAKGYERSNVGFRNVECNKYKARIRKQIQKAQAEGKMLATQLPVSIAFSFQNEFLEKWYDISEQLVDTIWKESNEIFLSVVKKQFQQFSNLEKELKRLINAAIGKIKEDTLRQIRRHWKQERVDKDSLNDHALQIKKAQFKKKNVFPDDTEMDNMDKDKLLAMLKKIKLQTETDSNRSEEVDQIFRIIVSYFSVCHERFCEFVIKELKIAINADFLDDFCGKVLRDELRKKDCKKLFQENMVIVKNRRDSERKTNALTEVIEILNKHQ